MIDDLKIDVEKLNKMVRAIKKTGIKEVSFEFLVGSCFPRALENIKEEMRRQYTLGYIAGQKEGEND